MRLPLIVVNFKVYEQGTGENALKLARIHERVAEATGANIAIAVGPLDLAKIVLNVKIPVFVQHMDAYSYGNHTGFVLADEVKNLGAYGVLLNHAEHPLENETLKKTIERAMEVGLFTIVCADTPERGREIMKFNPDLVAVEPPELIGGDVSVSRAGPQIIEKAVAMIGENRVLVGAGIKNSDDVKIALSLGASGVLLASGVVKSKDPYSVLLDLAAGLK